MSFSNTKPDSGPSPALDASQIQTNFAQWASIFATNHTAMNDFNQGDHEKVVMNNQANDPGVTENLCALYAKSANSTAYGNIPQLFAQIPKFLPNEKPNTGMQLTYNSVNTTGPIYQSFLPGGYVLYMGTTTNITVPVTLTPSPSGILIANVTANNVDPVTKLPYDASITYGGANTFTIHSLFNGGGIPGSYAFSWVVIGSQ